MSKFLSLIKAMGFSTAADSAVQVGVSTDTQPRLQIDAGGKYTWGAGGASAGDTNLYRSAADTLKTDDAFIATGGLTVKTTEIDTASATSGQALVFNGTKFAPATVSGGGGGTSVTVSDTAPTSPTEGSLWFESDTGLTYIYYDSFWIEIGSGGSYDPVTNTIQAKGDLIVGTASQALSRQAVGTDTQRLIANSSTTTGVSWANDSTNTVIDTKGDLLVGATNDVLAKLPVGTNNQVLVADTTATNGVSWQSRPWNLPWGVVAYAKKTTATNLTASIVQVVAAPSFTAVTGRVYKVTVNAYFQSISGSSYYRFFIFNGSTQIQGADWSASPTSMYLGPTMSTYTSGISGATVMSLQAAVGAGTGQVYADAAGYPVVIIVEDIGPG